MSPYSFEVFAWLACTCYALEVIVGKLTAQYSIKNPWFFNFVWNLLILLMTLPLAWGVGLRMPSQWPDLIYASIFYTLASILYVLCLFKLDVTVLSPLFNLRTAFSVILAWLFLGETLSFQQYGLIAVLFLCGIIVSLDERLHPRSFLSWGILIGIAEMLSLAFLSIFIKRAMQHNGYWEVSLWICILAQIFLLPTVVLFKKEVSSISRSQFGALLAMAVCGVGGTLASNRAYAENVSITGAILSVPISSLLSIILATIWPKLLEKHPWHVYAVRLCGTAVMVVCALQLLRRT